MPSPPDFRPVDISTVPIPALEEGLAILFRSSESVVLLGANGSGKTRLGVYIEATLAEKAHRIGAHRALNINTGVPVKAFDAAMRDLMLGNESTALTIAQRGNYRWQNNAAVLLLSDFDKVVVALYSEQSEVGVSYLDAADGTPRPKPKLRRLAEIWHHVLPHRKLVIKSASIGVEAVAGTQYDAKQLSDGERVIFYLLGHILLAPRNSVIVLDEPELHINRAVLQTLWDAAESERSDCAFLYITHDLEFASGRRGAARYVVRGVSFGPQNWDIEPIPANTGIAEEVVTRIVGSRTPILFVEGGLGSLDSVIYRHVYQGFTVHGAGSCEDVIRSVQSFNRHSFLHRIGCAGLIDADDRSADITQSLAGRNVHVLPVAEIENFFLLPGPFLELAKLAMVLDDAGAAAKLEMLKVKVFDKARTNIVMTAIESARRSADALLKKIELNKTSPEKLQESYGEAVAAINPREIYSRRHAEIEAAISSSNYERVLALYANKGLFAEMAAILGMRTEALESLIGRALGADAGRGLLMAVEAALPSETALLERVSAIRSAGS